MPHPATDFGVFDTVASIGSRAPDFWQNTGLLRVEPVGDATRAGTFRSSLKRLASEVGSFADVTMTPMTVRRDRSLCRRDGGDEIFLSLEMGGEVVTQAGASEAETKLPTGAIQIMDFGQPLAAHWEATIHRGLHLYLPRAVIGAALGPLDRLSGRILAPDGLVPMFVAQMRSLAEVSAGLSPVQRAVALQATVDLAMAVLRLELGREHVESEACQDGLFIAVQCFIDRNLASPNLTPERIAAKFRCSRAHLYRMFARHGLTVADYIREMRLQRCCVALERPPSGAESIADIAFRFGFENAVYFSRLFRQRFGFTPSEARRKAV